MDSIHLSPDQDSTASQEATQRNGSPEPSASVAEVMREQVEYLVDHVGAACFPGCPDCARLAQAKRCLLQPFT